MPKGKIDLDAKYADFERDGYVIFENVIEPDLVAEIKDALLRVERDNDMGFRDTDFEGCVLHTSDAADDPPPVHLGGRRLPNTTQPST